MDEGSPYTLTLGEITDLGDDTLAQYVVDWGDGPPETVAGDPPSVTHTYADGPAVYAITTTVVDEDGTFGGDPLGVTVLNVAPTVDAGPDASIDLGDTFAGSGHFADPGADSWSATADYGDGSGQQGLALNPDNTFVLSRAYAEAGTYTVTVTVTDDNLGEGVDTLTVTVGQMLPVEYALFAGGADSLTLATRARVQGGPIGSNGDADIGMWGEVGDVVAGGDVTVKSRASTGDITAGGSVQVHPRAYVGTVTEGADVPSRPLPEVGAEPGTQNIRRSLRDAREGPLDLVPGSYGTVTTAWRDHLILHGGEYHFSTLYVGGWTKITVDLSNGQPLVVRVQGNLTFGSRVNMEIVGGDASDVLFLVGGSNARLGVFGTYHGTFVAPDGKVTLGYWSALTGAAWGRDVLVKTRALVTLAPFAGW